MDKGSPYTLVTPTQLIGFDAPARQLAPRHMWCCNLPIFLHAPDVPSDSLGLVVPGAEEKPMALGVKNEPPVPTVLTKTKVKQLRRPSTFVFESKPWFERFISQGFSVDAVMERIADVVEVRKCVKFSLPQDARRDMPFRQLCFSSNVGRRSLDNTWHLSYGQQI